MDYSREPPHSKFLQLVHDVQPFNAEPLPHQLTQYKYTPDELVYCRNHGPVARLREDAHVITVDGDVARGGRITVGELKALFPRREVVAALQVCS